MSKKITWKNIKEYVEGNTEMLKARTGFSSPFLLEQVAYRGELCKDDCMIEKKCIYCGCDVPGKHYVKKSCNDGERFPDLMDKEQWEKFKIDNDLNEENL